MHGPGTRSPAADVARDRLTAATLTLLAGISVTLFFYYLQATTILHPYWDMFSHITRYLDFRENGDWWAYLWEPHVQHRHIWIRLLTAFDIEAFSGTGYPFVFTAAGCQIAAAWLLWRETRRSSPPEITRVVRCLVIMLVLTSVSAVDAAIPMNGIYPQTLLFSVLAITLFDGSDDIPAPGGKRLQLRRLAAVLAAMAAIFSNSAALALWPILLWLAWRGRAGRGWIAGLLLSGGAFVTVYLYGLPLAPEGGSGGLSQALRDPDALLKMATYFVTYLGLPWTRAAVLEIPGRVFGIALFGLALWAVVRHGILDRQPTRLERIAVALILFSLASAVLASIGRVDVGDDLRVPVRYSVFVTPLHVGLVWLAWPPFERLLAGARSRTPFRAAVIGTALLLAVQQVAGGQSAVRTTRSMKATIAEFAAGGESPEMTRVVFDNLVQARRDLNRIRNAGLYLSAR